jgi:hypothetical protein
MEPHRLRVGQAVQFIMPSRSSGLGGTPAGNFRVLGLLPNYQGNNQYRLQSVNDGHQRVVIESEIALE